MAVDQITIRPARQRDAVKIMGLLKRFHEEHLGIYPEPREADLLPFISWVIENGLVLVAEIAGLLVGTVALDRAPVWWNSVEPCRVLHDRWFYVLPRRRGGGVATKLIEGLTRHPFTTGQVIKMSVMTAGDLEHLDRFYRMQGARQIGGMFLIDNQGAGDV